MMTRRGLFCALVLLVLFSFPSMAQKRETTITLFAGSTFPVGSFGEKIGANPRITRRFGFDFGNKVGLAATGFTAGIELNQQVLLANLNWMISLKCLLNAVDNSQLESFYKNELGDSVNISLENGQWLNIPIFTGFCYDIPLFEKFRLYWTIQGGLNITRQPYRKAIVEDDVVEETTFRFTPDFGFEAGFGCVVLKKFSVGFRYLNLGMPRYEGTRKLNESFFTTIPKREMNVDGDERPISMIIIILGYHL